jgi:multidrug efflux pump subunit AcrB
MNGPGKQWEVGNVAEGIVKEKLALIDGVYDVNIGGYSPLQWNLEYDINQLKILGLSQGDVAKGIRAYFQSSGLGTVPERISKDLTYSVPLVLKGLDDKTPDWDKIHIRVGERLFRLTQLVKISRGERNPSYYYRINGLNTITIRIAAAPHVNHLKVGRSIKKELEALKEKFPDGYTLDISYDGTVFLKEEISKIILRIGLSLFVLLFFVWLVSRSKRYLLVILISMLANIFIAFIFYYLFGVEIHIYSLAGITISLGIIIDNTIVMTDHLRIGKGISVFRGVLAATLTTVGALVVVFFLDEEQQLLLIDFVYVIIINLGVSLLISLFFIPALLQRLPLPRPAEKRSVKMKQRLVKWYHGLKVCFTGMARFRRAFIWLGILGFGLPVFLLPTTIPGEQWYTKTYNATLGSQFYNEYIRKVVDYALGGSLRLFIKETKHNSGDQSVRRTTLDVSADMYDGTTLEKTNEIIRRVENYLTQFEEVEQFQTNIYGAGRSYIKILFTPEQEFTGFPSTLKSELESLVSGMGVGDWTITGVGRGFDNSLHEGYRNSRVTFYGYNLEKLKAYAEKFKEYLLDIQRVEANSIFINGRATRDDNIHQEHIVVLDQDKLAGTGVTQGRVLRELIKTSDNEQYVMDLMNEGNREKVVLKGTRSVIPDYWQFGNQALEIGEEKVARMGYLGSLKKERMTDLINKENMEYTMMVEFDFIGSGGQEEYLIGRVIKKMQDELPIGFRLEQQTFYGDQWSKDVKNNNYHWVILLVLVIIFGICAVVFESLKQPLLVLSMIPLSFIGVFLTFYLFDIPFGQGGYAAFLLLSGLTVNSALYLINDLNHVRKQKPRLSADKQYIKALQQKVVPILLTIFSTVLGLVPFLIHGNKEPFWYSLAMGTIGGLIFSLLALFVYLPMFVKGMKRKREKGKRRMKPGTERKKFKRWRKEKGEMEKKENENIEMVPELIH